MRSALLGVRGPLRPNAPPGDACFQPELDTRGPDADERFLPLPTATNPFPLPNPDPGGCISDHRVFVKFDQLQGNSGVYTQFFEWVGSLHPYQYVELESDLDPRITHTVTVVHPTDPTKNFDVPNAFLRLGRRRVDAYRFPETWPP